MVPKALLALSIGALVATATGIVFAVDGPNAPEPKPDAAVAETPKLVPSNPFSLTWEGYYKLGLADCLMVACPAHTYETEPLVEPLAKAGVRVDVPADTSLLEFELRWTGNEELHLMIHGPMKEDHSMPSYMAMGGSTDRLCVSVPKEEIVGGVWEVMAHAGSFGYQDTPFTILVNGEGGQGAKLREGPHGHPIQEDWSMEMRQAQPCRNA